MTKPPPMLAMSGASCTRRYLVTRKLRTPWFRSALEIPWIGVYFLDDQLRRQVTYVFSSPDGGKLFLKEYQRFEFADDGSKKSSERTTFQKDGLLKVTEVDLVAKTTYEYNVMADMSDNWEPIPAFGDYASIARFECGTAS